MQKIPHHFYARSYTTIQDSKNLFAEFYLTEFNSAVIFYQKKGWLLLDAI
jgi:hypothetical protein